MTVRTVAVCTAGGTSAWTQQGAVNITAPVNVVTAGYRTAIVFTAAQDTWQQEGDVSLWVGVGVGIMAGVKGAVAWNQTGTLDMTIFGRSGNDPTGVLLPNGGIGMDATWAQRGPLSITIDAVGDSLASGIMIESVSNNNRWLQLGDAVVRATVSAGALAQGVRLGGSTGLWNQSGNLRIDMSRASNSTAHAVVFGASTQAGNLWNQYGDVAVNISPATNTSSAIISQPSAAVRALLLGGTWRSMGHVTLAVDSPHDGDAYPMWLATDGYDFAFDRAIVLAGADTVRCDVSSALGLVQGLPMDTPTQGMPPRRFPPFSSNKKIQYPFFWRCLCKARATWSAFPRWARSSWPTLPTAARW
ncbi:MAG TPA: hypothetical protein VIO38_06690 [Rariglobus sp.]